MGETLRSSLFSSDSWDAILRKAIVKGHNLDRIATDNHLHVSTIIKVIENPKRFSWAQHVKGYLPPKEHVIEPTVYPAPPELDASGSYDPASLLRFFDAADKDGAKDREVAILLKVETHRIAYLRSPMGRAMLSKKAHSHET